MNNRNMTDDSSDSMDLTFQAVEAEFTLEDTLGVLKDLKLDRDKELEEVYSEQMNNHRFAPLNHSSDVLKKQKKLLSSFQSQVASARPDDHAIPNTDDMVVTLLAQVDEEIENFQLRVEAATLNLERRRENISRLKEKKADFEKMREACLAANEIIASRTHEAESEIAKEIFRDVKADTHEVVAELFPDGHMRDFLAELCSAYFADDNDLYVEITPEYADAANFLLEADVITHHPYDKQRVRLVDL